MIATTTYRWADGRGFRVSAQTTGEIVAAIKARDGVCSAAALVDEARSTVSPIHELFEWDDTVAAEAYRKDQAREVIALVRIESNGPAFVHVTVARDGIKRDGYMPVEEALAGPARQQVLVEAKRQLQGHRKRYGFLTELAKVWSVIDAEVAS